MSVGEKRQRFWTSVVFAVVGVFVVLVSLGVMPPVGEDVINGPPWVLSLVGLLILSTAGAGLLGPYGRASTFFVAGACVLASVVFGWVALFGDPSKIQGGIPILSDKSNQFLGKAVFGGAALAFCLVGLSALKYALRPRGAGLYTRPGATSKNTRP